MNLHLVDTNLMVLAGVAILLVAALVWLIAARRTSTTAKLRKKFGPEYDRAVGIHGAGRKAETKLEDREKRVEKFKIRELEPAEREGFLKQWESVQSHFVDS